MLPAQINIADDTDIITPKKITGLFRDAAMPFLDLQGHELPQHFHTVFDQIDTTTREEVLIGLDILDEAWQDIKSEPNGAAAERQMHFAGLCASVIQAIELYVIPQTSELRDELKPIPA